MADASASPALGTGALAAIAAAFPGTDVRLVLAREGGRLAGGTAVAIERRGPFRWLHALPMLLPAAPVAADGGHAGVDAAVAAAIGRLARELRVVGGAWAPARLEGPPVADAALAAVPGERRWMHAAVVRLGDGVDGALRRMDRKHRQSLQQAQAREFAAGEEPDALDAAYALHVAQGRRWHGHRALPLELSRRLLAAAGGAPAARLFTLRRHGELVSATLALDGPHETFAWWSGTHPEGRRHDAFARLLWSVVEWAAARGRRRVNLGASGGLAAVETFKRALGAEDVRYPVLWLDARHSGAPGRALAWAQRRWRAGRARGEAA